MRDGTGLHDIVFSQLTGMPEQVHVLKVFPDLGGTLASWQWKELQRRAPSQPASRSETYGGQVAARGWHSQALRQLDQCLISAADAPDTAADTIAHHNNDENIVAMLCQRPG